MCSGLTSLSALVVTILDPYFWWADSGTGGLVALYTLYKGISTMIHSMVSKNNSSNNYNDDDNDDNNNDIIPGEYLNLNSFMIVLECSLLSQCYYSIINYSCFMSCLLCLTQHSLRELKDEQKRRAYFCSQTTTMDSSNSEKYDEIRYVILNCNCRSVSHRGNCNLFRSVSSSSFLLFIYLYFFLLSSFLSSFFLL